jgi:hypothetical protein
MTTKQMAAVIAAALMGMLGSVGTASAEISEDVFERKVAKIAGRPPTSGNGLCVCQDGSSNHGLAGVLEMFPAGSTTERKIRVLCGVRTYTNSGFGATSCFTYVPLTK